MFRQMVLPALLSVSAVATTDGFLGGLSADHRATDQAFWEAIGAVASCGQDGYASRQSQLADSMRRLWDVLPKNRYGRIEWNLLRYVVHRHFMQKSSLLIRGFEPTRQVNASNLGVAGLLSRHVPPSVDQALKDKHASVGFSLEEVTATVAAIEQQIQDQERSLLERAFKQVNRDVTAEMNKAELVDVVEAYVINWMMHDDVETVKEVLKDRSLITEVFTRWSDADTFAANIVESIDFFRRRHPSVGDGRAVMLQKYSFQHALEAASFITRSFAEYWEPECQNIKSSLVELDRDGSGRVRFEDFYGTNDDGEWRFGESESYLRELGALDETSQWRGKQVVIPNYLQGASNCIVTSPNYLVCCVNECEAILQEIEDIVGSPVADAATVRDIVSNMTDFNDERPYLDDLLLLQLRQIAEMHSGQIPLHGRLFAQWLHYAFPQECPFPHKSGVAAWTTPLEFAGNYAVTTEEVEAMSKARNFSLSLEELKEVESLWMTQWTEEEELLADYAQNLQNFWTLVSRWKLAAFGGMLASGMVGLAILEKRQCLPACLSLSKGDAAVHFL
eukprot:TRINITY_DN39306_c0_g1_i1.p1 TRINITY_DN39306_c0_g1~~TRINITY_DN39306_c0_g1_i1.p1  ORF type:complete len:562 (+),score=146.49 TRINITY_DN39306_c0_g1_i1:105-1790(+)